MKQTPAEFGLALICRGRMGFDAYPSLAEGISAEGSLSTNLQVAILASMSNHGSIIWRKTSCMIRSAEANPDIIPGLS